MYKNELFVLLKLRDISFPHCICHHVMWLHNADASEETLYNLKYTQLDFGSAYRSIERIVFSNMCFA